MGAPGMTVRTMVRALVIAGLAVVSPKAAAQATQAGRANDPFSAAQLKRIVETISHDSLVGRPTPSPALEIAAQYVAGHFRAAGLEPLGDEGGYMRRFPVLETVLDPDSARIEVGSLATWRFGTDFWYAAGAGGDPRGILRGPTVIVTGAVTAESGKGLGIGGKVVIYVSPLGAGGRPSDFRSAFALMDAGAVGVVIPGGRPDSAWRRIGRDPDEHKPSVEAAWSLPANERPTDATAATASTEATDRVVGFIPVLELWGGRLGELLRASRIDSPSLYGPGPAPKATPIGTDASLFFARSVERISWPANVVGMVRGQDPILRDEYVVVTAHLDGLGEAKGVRPGPQAVLNGADDNASGIAAIVQMARTLSSSGSRARRSVIFAAVSGEERGLWGSDYLASRSPVPIAKVVANVNLDMIGRSKFDTVYLVGRADSALGPVVERSLRAVSSRGLVVLEDRELDRRYPKQRFTSRSDHASFTRRGVPALWLFTGPHADYHGTTDDAPSLNYAALERISRLAYDLTLAIANTSELRGRVMRAAVAGSQTP